MNYEELSVEERIRLAADYLLIALENEKAMLEDILKDTGTIFYLDQQQLQKAYTQIRSQKSKEFQSVFRKANLRVLSATIMGIILGILMIYLGLVIKEPLYTITGIVLAATGLLSGSTLIYRYISDRRLFQGTAETTSENRQSKGKNDVEKVLLAYGFIALCLTCITGWNYFAKSGYIDPQSTVSIPSKKLYHPVIQKSTGGKNARRYYQLEFCQDHHRYRLYKEIYKYAVSSFHTETIKPGDRLTIVVRKSDEKEATNEFGTGSIELVNLLINGEKLVDLPKYNKGTLWQNRLGFIISLLLSLILGVILFARRSKGRKT